MSDMILPYMPKDFNVIFAENFLYISIRVYNFILKYDIFTKVKIILLKRVVEKMFLIAGLGNPGKEYAGTKHNVGFEVLNKLAYDNKIEYKKMKARAAIAESVICGQKVLLCKPHTYMNLSGESIAELVRFYKIEEGKVIVAYDDTDINVGDIRIRTSGSAGGHNGIKSIMNHLKTGEFIRVRVGIGQKPEGWDLADYVLSKFRKDEIDDIVTGITKATDAIELMLKTSVEETMNIFNRKQTL